MEIIEKEILSPPPIQWLNDKSDLDSLDSDYFKNSSHQPDFVDIIDQHNQHQHHHHNHYQQEEVQHSELNILEIQIHDETYNQQEEQQQQINSVSTSSTSTITTNSEIASEQYSVSCNIGSVSTRNISSFDEIILTSSEKDSDSSGAVGCSELSFNHNTSTSLDEHQKTTIGGESEFESKTYKKRSKFKEDRKSVVSYDSIYLSSEGSAEQTLADDHVEDPLPEICVNTNGEFVTVVDLPTTEAKEITTVECLYSEIKKKKKKPKVNQPEKKSKSNLTSFSDTSTRGTLERLTIITTPAQHNKEFQHIEGKLFANEPFVGSLTDNNQYCSLPDAANISISLRASEHIDAKLRQSCNTIEATSDEVQNPIYDSISRFGRAHKRLRQRESFEIVVLNPISIDDQTTYSTNTQKSTDTQKSIEAEKSTEEIEESVEQIEQPKQNIEEIVKKEEATACLGNKPVIVDELAAKLHRNLAIFESHNNKAKKLPKNVTDIQIIVTDTQNNIVEQSGGKEEAENSIEKSAAPKIIVKKDIESAAEKRQRSTTTKPPPIPPPLPPPPPPKPQASPIHHPAPPKETQSNDFRINLTDTLRSRIAQSRSTFSAKPVRVYSCENIQKLDATYEIHPSLTYKVKIKDKSSDSKMSRPQILNVVDTKRNVCSVAPQRQNVTAIRQSFIQQFNNDPKMMPKKQQRNQRGSIEPQQEFQDKVDSIRCYWSKFTKDLDEAVDKVDFSKYETIRRISSEASDDAKIGDNGDGLISNCKNEKKSFISNSTIDLREHCGSNQLPTVEMVELDGQKQAAIVNPQHATNADFDHVRYKVMRSDTFQKNMLAQQTRKEAQFDGLLQYLHNYSFQVN